jgi:NAD/NADP transhydrogenase beta subunit
MKAIAWSFIGLRRKSDFDVDDAGAMNPFHVLIAALIGAFIFIGALIAFAKYATA